VQPGSVRAVEYEVVSNQADIFGLTEGTLKNELAGLRTRCDAMRRRPVPEAHGDRRREARAKTDREWYGV
jgi:hypothetical protein